MSHRGTLLPPDVPAPHRQLRQQRSVTDQPRRPLQPAEAARVRHAR